MESYATRNGCRLVLWIFLSVLYHECDAQNATLPEVTIGQGTLRGLNMMTNTSKQVFGFLGIPYAEPPIGNLRFSAPVKAPAWNGTFNASDDGSACPQIYRNVLFGDEDCLSVNVYTPKIPDNGSSLLPTMVYIYGGGLKTGYHDSVRYGPGYLLKDDDLVLVVPNYRGDVLGFLNTGDEVAPGNQALKDLVLALTWVQENIASFGGDPNRVTIFGQSSGGSVVHLLSLSDSTEGLFHTFISQSGSALYPNTFISPEISVERAFTFGNNYFNCSANTSTELISCLRQIDALEMIVAANSTGIMFGVSKEPDVEGAFLTDSPRNLSTSGKVRDLPWITGVTRDEGLHEVCDLWADPKSFDDFLASVDQKIAELCDKVYDSAMDLNACTDALKAYYLNDLTADRDVLLNNVTSMFGDAIFTYPLWEGFQNHLTVATNPTWFYSFDYVGALSYTYIYCESWDVYGAAHGDDIIYRFPQTEAIYTGGNVSMTATDMEMVDIAVQLWTSFAINGTPTTTALNGATWEPYQTAESYLQIGNDTRATVAIMKDFYNERMQFWNNLTETLTAETSAASSFSTRYISISLIICYTIEFIVLTNRQ